MQSLDPSAYEYFRTLNLILTTGATPANLKSNFSGGALGYFSADSWCLLRVKVP